ncbi:hypothetical protein [Amycolatopsis sulphurea]|uniref:hypothetical protein n=1 Tax=Amycolatopsis sulphurea TaxID=76022 RepID=UPI001B808CFF|nr:hypothetical protein [Amycolatopsis sulphurea]
MRAYALRRQPGVPEDRGGRRPPIAQREQDPHPAGSANSAAVRAMSAFPSSTCPA